MDPHGVRGRQIFRFLRKDQAPWGRKPGGKSKDAAKGLTAGHPRASGTAGAKIGAALTAHGAEHKGCDENRTDHPHPDARDPSPQAPLSPHRGEEQLILLRLTLTRRPEIWTPEVGSTKFYSSS